MRIHGEQCIACGRCKPFCIMNAISFTRSGPNHKLHCIVDEEKCVDCGACIRAKVCPEEALYMPDYKYPRTLRGDFSNPTQSHKSTNNLGRGTEEMKTNDVTHRFKAGYFGIAAEMGRPGIGTTFRDAEKVFMALAPLGVEFEDNNPLTSLLVDKKTGKMDEACLDERALSAIVEMVVPENKAVEVLRTLREVAKEVKTVFSVDLVAKCEEDGTSPAIELAEEIEYWHALNGKTNLGLGKMHVKGADEL